MEQHEEEFERKLDSLSNEAITEHDWWMGPHLRGREIDQFLCKHFPNPDEVRVRDLRFLYPKESAIFNLFQWLSRKPAEEAVR